VTFIIVFISLMFVTNALAQTAPAMGPKAERKRVSGTVVAIDTASKTLVVEDWRGETTFDTDGAKLVRGANLEDIRPGDRVVMSYAEEGGRKTAKIVIATPPHLNKENKVEALRGP
jgi:hypothetical protein